MSKIGKSRYFEIKQLIEQEIIFGKFPTGHLLPSEPQLADIYNVSRGTIRQALGALEREAIIARRAGIGTMVVRNPRQKTVASFSEQILRMGKKPSAKVLKISTIPITEASGRCQEAFMAFEEPNQNALVYCIERLRLADDVPVAHHKVYLRITDFGPDFLNDDFTGSIYAIYHRYQKRLIWANEIIQARSANEKEIQLFNLMALPTFQRIVYLRDRITYNEENIGTEVLESVERSDFFKSYQYRLMIEET